MDYRTFFGFIKEPFSSQLKSDEILITDQLANWRARFDFITSHKLWGLLTGEVGAGKSTAIRWAAESLPPPEFKPIMVTATGGSILELYRRILHAIGHPKMPGYRAKMIELIIQTFAELVSQRITPVLVIDEASLLRLEGFRELHILSQYHCDSKPIVSVILVGQEDLIDKLAYPSSKPLASRITARMHLVAGSSQDSINYVNHHLKIAGITTPPFDEPAMTALHQASGGIPRNINNLARCSLITAAAAKRQVVTAEDVRVASTELFLSH